MKTYLQILVMSLFLLIIGFGIGSWGMAYAQKLKTSKTQNIQENSEIDNEENTKDFVESDKNEVDINAESFNVVLQSYGGIGHSGGSLADSIILVHVDSSPELAEGKKVVLISIPRDFWFSGQKLNANPSIKDAVASITGLSVKNYISVDFDSFIRAINKLGGVEVDIPKPYTDNFYPVRGLENELCGFSPEKVASLHQKYSGFNLEKQFTCRYETIHFDIGKTTMDGQTALKYVRSRHGDGDFGRSERQFFLLKGLLYKNLSVSEILDMSNIVKTSLTTNEIKSLVKLFGNPLDYEIKTIHLSDANVLTASKSSAGAYILIPRAGIGNFDEIKKFIAK